MTWTRFGYICRRALLDIESGAPVAYSLACAETEEGSELHGKAPGRDTLPRVLLDSLAGLSRQESAVSALRTYGRLDLACIDGESLTFKRLVVYLCCVVFVFYAVLAIYQLKVIPKLTEALVIFKLQAPEPLIFFQDHWLSQVATMSLLLLMCMLSMYQVKQLFLFKNNAGKGLLAKTLLGPGIRNSYGKVKNILCFPVGAIDIDTDDVVVAHLARIQSVGTDIPTEVRELVQLEMRELHMRCERQLKIMSAAVALIIILTVFMFLTTVYAPIFLLGGIV